MSNILNKLLNAEIINLPEKARPWMAAFVVVFTIIFSIQFTLLFHNLTYLGPGLGDELSALVIKDLVFNRIGGSESVVAWLVGIFVLAVILFRAAVMLWSYFGYPKVFGVPFPMHIVPVFILVNAVGALAIPLMLAVLGGILYLAGYDFNNGWLLIENTVSSAHVWVMNHVPTIVALPGWLAIICVYFVAGFFHYWLHRLGHESRTLWLLFHRHHHMTPNLTQQSTVAVFFAFPLFIVLVAPYVFIFAAITKLFSPEPLYAETFIFNCLLMVPEIFGHSDVLYEKARKWKWASIPGFVFCNGVYHYLHHSAEPVDSVLTKGIFKGRDRKVNMVNMGGGLFFFWDIVFGTFTPLRDKRPRVGLTGQPELVMNPLRLGLSGIAQLIYELKHNPVSDWFMILCGPSDFVPKNSKDYALKQAR